MRTFVFAFAGALVVAWGLGYSLQPTQLASTQSAPSRASSSPAIGVEPITVHKVQSNSVVKPDAAEGAVGALFPLPIETSRTDYYEVQPASSAEADEPSNHRAVAEMAELPAAFAVAARAEEPRDDMPTVPSATSKGPKQKSTKNLAAPEKAKKHQPHAQVGSKSKTNDETGGKNRKLEAAKGGVQTPSSASSEFANPISKLRELFGAQ